MEHEKYNQKYVLVCGRNSDDIKTIERNADVLLNACKYIGLAVNIGKTKYMEVGLGSLGVTWSPRDPRFAGSNPTGVDVFFQDIKVLSTSPLGGTLS